MQKKHVFFVVILILALAILIGILGKAGKSEQLEKKSPDPKADLTKPYQEVRVVKEDTKSVLSAFPAGFPAEAGVENKDSFKYVPANSTQQQSTVEYVSSQSLAENTKAFSTYLTANGYTITNKLEQGSLVFYYGTKADSDLSVKLEDKDGKVLVTASYLKK